MREVLEAARAMVADKWTQGSYGNPVSGYCVVGALSETSLAIEGTYRAHPGYHDACLALRRHLPDVGWSISDNLPEFNDDVTTTQDVVLALFDKTLADENIQ